MKKIFTTLAIAAAMTFSLQAQSALGSLLGGLTGGSGSGLTGVINSLAGVVYSAPISLDGTYAYSGVAVSVTSSEGGLVSNLAGSAVTSGIEAKVDEKLAKWGIKPGMMTITFNNADGSFVWNIGKIALPGTYKVGDAEKTVTLTFGKTMQFFSMTGTLESGLTEAKMLFTLHPPAFSNWCAFARSWLTHRNPYTGRTYAEEPCWTGMSLINEGRYVFPFEQTRELVPFKKAWRDWISARRAEDPDCYPGIPVSSRYPKVEYADMQNCTLPQVCCDFAADMQRGFLKRVRSFLVGELGFRAPLSNENNASDNVAISLARSDAYDYVEVHAYGGGQGRVEGANKVCRVPNRNVFLPAHDRVTESSWRRIVDKPFSITETSYGQPNPHRAGGYAKLGALAAFQDWGSIFHFAYAHGLKNFPEGAFGGGTRFDIQQDPIKALADKIPFLLFLRRDLQPAPEGVALVLDEAALHPKSGVGAGSMPAWGTNFMWRCRVGSIAPGHVASGVRTIPHQNGFDKADPPFSPAPCKELEFDEALGVLKVDTPRTVVGVLPGGRFDTPRVKCILGDNPATVVAAAVDGKELERSGRILFMVLGDVQRLGEVYANESRTVMLKRGNNGKTVVRRMKAPVMLRLENPSAYAVYAVDTSGSRLGKIRPEVKGNRLMFVANTEFSPGTGVIAWEIVK